MKLSRGDGDMTVIVFEDDDDAYLRWVAEHPDGYVVNMRRRLDPNYIILHRADCPTIARYPNMDKDPGGFTERAFRKLCSTSLSELRGYLAPTRSEPDSFSKVCSRCARA